MSTISTGVFKTLAFKKQTGLGTIAAAGAGGTSQYVRRTKSTIDLGKNTYQSNEILVSQQHRDMRHGIRAVSGTLSGELSVGGYQKPMESILRQVSVAAISTGALTNVTAAVTTGAQGTFTRAAGSFLTDGFCVGDVVNSTGWTTTGGANNNHYSQIVALTATVMTVQFLDAVAMGAKASGDSVTIVQLGKKTYIPASGQTRDYYTIEHWFSDIAQSEVFTDCVFTTMAVNLPSNGMATVDFGVMGLNLVTAQAQYFTSPAAAPTGGILAAVNGLLILGGNVVGYITAANIKVDGKYSTPGGVVGSTADPDIFPGPVDVTGQITVLFTDNVSRDLFVNETEFSLSIVLTSAKVAAPGFTCFNMSRVKFTGATKDDGTAGISLTMPFTALENVSTSGAGFPNLQTTLSIQDGAFV